MVVASPYYADTTYYTGPILEVEETTDFVVTLEQKKSLAVPIQGTIFELEVQNDKGVGQVIISMDSKRILHLPLLEYVSLRYSGAIIRVLYNMRFENNSSGPVAVRVRGIFRLDRKQAQKKLLEAPPCTSRVSPRISGVEY